MTTYVYEADDTYEGIRELFDDDEESMVWNPKRHLNDPAKPERHWIDPVEVAHLKKLYEEAPIRGLKEL
jgi:hypothetical protein